MCLCNTASGSGTTSCRKYKIKLKTLRSALISVFKTETDPDKKENDSIIVATLNSYLTDGADCISPTVLSEINNYVTQRLN